ncbi:MAG: amidohydrolase family protein [Gammaproteobacteria bacterium]|nr:amidohydrolase family protein [Gammaproteobacteria bacterium]
MTVTAFENCRIFDGHGPEYIEDHRVVVAEGRIQALEPMSGKPPQDADIVDCGGRVLMPGLIDCHFHAYGVSFSFYELDRMPRELLAQHGAKTMRDTLHRGFTTIRDAAGADIGLWLALEQRLIEGPRLYYPGRALSQTGGHGDMRPGDEIEATACACGYMGSLTVTADGPDEVRKAVREELRKGAHQIKIFISGGVVSPTDPLWMPQYSDEEVRAAVEEAATRRTYVMAHCHTDDGARRCVDLGVRTIEHGSEILDDTAAAIVEAGAYVVPTLSVMHVIKDHAGQLGLPSSSQGKILRVHETMLAAMETCARHGVKLGLGSDLLGHEYMKLQGREFAYRGEVHPPLEVLRSATSVNAEILRQEGNLGCIALDAHADLLVLEGDPMKNLNLFADASNIPVIMKAGRFVRRTGF